MRLLWVSPLCVTSIRFIKNRWQLRNYKNFLSLCPNNSEGSKFPFVASLRRWCRGDETRKICGEIRFLFSIDEYCYKQFYINIKLLFDQIIVSIAIVNVNVSVSVVIIAETNWIIRRGKFELFFHFIFLWFFVSIEHHRLMNSPDMINARLLSPRFPVELGVNWRWWNNSALVNLRDSHRSPNF